MKTGLQFWRKMLLLHLLISSTLITVYGQGRKVTGTVADAISGEAMPGVNLVIKGTTNGTTTDANGAFSIVLKDEDNALIVSFIGYKTQEVALSPGQTTLGVKLEADVTALQEVVVVGFGTQQKSHLTGAVASTNMDNFIKVPTGDALNALQGQVAGVSVANATGAPGAAPVVQIRGLGTINGSSPLYVIDGIPSEPSYLNPAEIESISVLKDASAATIYGARGSNGVILITTKRGKSGKPQITINSFVAANDVNLNGVEAVSKAQKNTIMQNAYNNAGLTPPTWAMDNSKFADTRWADAYFKTGFEQKHDLSIAGGTDDVTYSFAGGYYSNNGTVINTGLNRYNSRLNLDFKNLLHDHLKFNLGVSFVRKDLKNFSEALGQGNADFSPIMSLYTALPHKEIYDPTSPNGFAGQDPLLGVVGAGNPIGSQTLQNNKNQDDYIQLNWGADLKLLPWLTYQFKLGVNSENTYNDTFLPAYNFGPGATVETPRTWQERGRTNSSIFNNLLNIKNEFNDHSIAVLLGQSSERYATRSVGGSNLEQPSSLVPALDAGIGTRNAYGGIVENRLLSFFGRATYSYANKYFLEGSVRKDGSTRFGPANRWGTFYAVSGGWAIHRERFFNIDFISELKPRFSYGVVGNQSIGDYKYQSLITVGSSDPDYPSAVNYPFGSSRPQVVATGASALGIGTPDIKWEQTTTSNIGLDLGLLENKLTFTIDYYQSKTEGMLVERRPPGSAGIQKAPTTNAGNLENKGLEVTATYRNEAGAFKYSVSGNVGTSQNKVTRLGYEGQEFIDGYVEYNNYATTRTAVGTQVGEFYLKEVAGIFQTQQEIDAYKGKDGELLQPNAAPGDFKFVDINNDGVINDKDKRSFGSGLPKASFGLTFNASWKSFDFTLMFNGTAGNKMYNAFKMEMYRLNASPDLLNSWTSSNTGTDVPRLNYTDPNSNYTTASNYFLENASYVRLRNLQIGYTLPVQLAESIGLTRLRVFAGGYNLFTITKYTGFDPGLSNTGKFSRGVDKGFYPISRSLVAGITIGL
jgi:TonB-linked SusC/RagA family outer membrane protein